MSELPSSEYDLAPGPVGETAPKTGAGLPRDDEEEGRPASKPAAGPPKPLPRLHRSAPLTVNEADQAEGSSDPDRPRPLRKEREAGRTRVRSKGDVGIEADGKRPMEATPELDTHDTRQRVRFALGTIAGLVVLVSVVSVFRTMSGGGSATEDTVYVIEEPDFMDGPARGARPPGSVVPPKGAGPAEPGGAGTVAQTLAPDYNANPRGDNEADSRLPAPYAPVPAPVAPASRPVISTDVAEPGVVSGRSPLPRGFQAHAEARFDARGWPDRIVCERDGSEMVLVPGGVYLLGRPDGSIAEAPAVRVEIPAFYLDRTEVTVDQYNRYREDLSRRGQTVYPDGTELAQVAPSGTHPVVLVNWAEASAYAAWAGKTLPTEAQWEAAARGLDGRLRPWGSQTPSWFSSRPNRRVDQVGSYADDRTPLDIYDLGANAWEWTADWYDSRYHELLARQMVSNPGGPSSSRSSPPQRTIKGSSRTYEASYREGMRVDARLPYLGFRCCLPISGPAQLLDGSTAPSLPTSPPGRPPSAPSPGGAGVVPF